MQGAKEPALGRGGIGCLGFLPRQRVEGDHGVQAGILLGDPFEVQFQAFDGRQPAFPQGEGPLDHGQAGQLLAGGLCGRQDGVVHYADLYFAGAVSLPASVMAILDVSLATKTQ